jgi:hypothetical protein
LSRRPADTIFLTRTLLPQIGVSYLHSEINPTVMQKKPYHGNLDAL